MRIERKKLTNILVRNKIKIFLQSIEKWFDAVMHIDGFNNKIRTIERGIERNF